MYRHFLTLYDAGIFTRGITQGYTQNRLATKLNTHIQRFDIFTSSSTKDKYLAHKK